MPGRVDSESPRPEIPGYRIVRSFGAGGMGKVYYAIQQSLNRPVVIKVAHHSDGDSQGEASARFEREALLQAKGSHPNVVGIIDRGTIDGRLYIVMEYVEGGDLRSRLKSDSPMTLEEARKLLLAIGRAVSALHEKSIVHLDLKPENVLLDRDGTVRIADFGISVTIPHVGELSDTDASLGTLDYMAPEQRHRLGVDQRADQYSLALIAYEVLTARRPTRVIVPPSEYNSDLVDGVDQIILKALNYDPDDRFEKILEFSEALDVALQECFDRGGVAWTTLGRIATIPGRLVLTNSGRLSRPRVAVLGVVILLASVAAFGLYSQRSSVDVIDVPIDLRVTSESSEYDISESSEYIEQTAALPYRFDEGILQFLLVRTRRDSHWTIPKATQRSRESLADTANEEALEEAGVLGSVGSSPLGTYTYKREGTRYRVTVLPVLVEEQRSTWPEQFRARKWCTKEMALHEIAATGLRNLVRVFSPTET